MSSVKGNKNKSKQVELHQSKSFCPSIHPPIHPSTHPSTPPIHLSIHPPIHQSADAKTFSSCLSCLSPCSLSSSSQALLAVCSDLHLSGLCGRRRWEERGLLRPGLDEARGASPGTLLPSQRILEIGPPLPMAPRDLLDSRPLLSLGRVCGCAGSLLHQAGFLAPVQGLLLRCMG